MPRQPKDKKKERATEPSPFPKKPLSKTTSRCFGQVACMKMARYYKERIGAELLSQKPRWNKDLEMWEFDILKED